MSERKTWLEEEDKVLKMLVEERGQIRWALIARVMTDEFQLTGRTGKQCRERYHNHLDNRIKHGPWSKQEQKALIALQNNMGNHWAEISRALAGRSQNCVKNKFYSILRRGVKALNLAIKRHFKKYKELEVATIYRIIDGSEPLFGSSNLSAEAVESNEIKKQLFFYGVRQDIFPFNKEQYADIKQLIDRIRAFKKNHLGKKKTNLGERSAGPADSERLASNEIKEDQKFQTKDIQRSQEQVGKELVYGMSPLGLKKLSLQSFGLEPLDQDIGEGRPMMSGTIYEPILSKNLSIFSNLSNIDKRSSSNEQHHSDLLRKDSTFKSFEFPEHDPLRSPFVMLESPHFDQLRGNFNSWSYLFHPHP